MNPLEENEKLTTSEAAYRWNLKRNTVIAALNRGRFDKQLEEGSVRKFTLHGATEWYISVKAMKEVFGDEDKVQIYELWRKVGDENPPELSLNFKGHHIKTYKNDEEIPDDLLERLRAVEDYEDAYEIVTGIKLR